MVHTPSDIFNMELSEQFRIFENGLSNSTSGQISDHLSIFGYTPEKVNAGLELVNKTRELYVQQQKEFGEQLTATSAFHDLKDHAEKRVGITWKIAKIAVKDRGTRKVLGLHRERKYSPSGWIKQFDQFYRNIDSDVLTALSEFGYHDMKITEEKDMVDQVIRADKVQDDETSEAQAATVHRDESVDSLHGWMRNFYKVSKMALADEPELLEQIGIIHRN